VNKTVLLSVNVLEASGRRVRSLRSPYPPAELSTSHYDALSHPARPLLDMTMIPRKDGYYHDA
jgi:hypothetical protein